MSSRTIFLSKLLGLYSILISLAMISHKAATVETVNAMIHNPPLLLLTGVLTLSAGLALVIGHNYWSGGAVPVLVTVIGWLTLLKGLVLVSLSPEQAVNYFEGLHYEQFFYAYTAIALILGSVLTIGGYGWASRQPLSGKMPGHA